ncbi:hypothetical protein RND81_02G160000 [Saponaria officinalis]|uniref:Histone-lysine N-methyltransferase SUVR5 n=1 Tax=Saponaria officinalis TaxID=3572 RepID=A0AAW1MTV3_SAPOF
MELVGCSNILYGEKSRHAQQKSVIEYMDYVESNGSENTKLVSPPDKNVGHVLTNVKVVMGPTQCNFQEKGREPSILEAQQSSNCSLSCEIGENGRKSGNNYDHEDSLEEQRQCREACLDFQTSHVDVNTIDSETLYDNKDAELSISASKWPEHDEALPLWVKWRGKWQAGIKCERADWPLATVKAKPTHGRKSYIVIFFPHSRNYSWADTLLVCAIDELPQPIAHRSHKAGVQLVADLTVARRFILKKLVIGVLNIVDQLPIQMLAENARDVVVWREFAAEASRCKGYPDLGRLLVKLQNMLLPQYINSKWLQHSFHLWAEKCQNAFSADSIELLKEELVESILWSEVSSLRDVDGQRPLGSEWKLWKLEVMKCFSTTASQSGGREPEQPGKNVTENLSRFAPVIISPQVSRKRPKLEIRRAETNNSRMENKSPQKPATVEIDSSFFIGIHNVIADNIVVPSKIELVSQGTPKVTSLGNSVDRWDEVVSETSNAKSVSNKDTQSENVNGVFETKFSASNVKSRQCTAFIEAKGRRCVRWANEGDDYCCAHLLSRVPANSLKMETSPPADAPMCVGTTTAGHQCKRRAVQGSSVCKKHHAKNDGMKSPGSTASFLKRKHDELSDKSEFNTCKDIVIVPEAQQPYEERSITLTTENVGANCSLGMLERFAEEVSGENIETACCVGLGLENSGAICPDSPTRHSLYCDKHLPIWLKRARNGKCRIISKEVFIDLLRTCSSQLQKIRLHEACEIFYKLLKSILSLRNPVPKEIQLQWALSEVSKDMHVADVLLKLVSREKERLHRVWGLDLFNNQQVSSAHAVEQALVPYEQVSSAHANEQALVPFVEKTNNDGTCKCKICSVEFFDDQTLGAHWISNHNKEAQWLFRGYACAICLDSFTNKKVLETHVQERHHAQFVEHCMLIQCVPCGSHFGNSEELWSHVLSVHKERFRQSETRDVYNLSAASHQNSVPIKPPTIEDSSGTQSGDRRFICKFCGLKFDLLPDLGRHHQAAHMGPSALGSRPKKKGLHFYTYRLKSGRLSRPRLKKGLAGASYRLRNTGGIMLKKRLQPPSSQGGGGINMKSHVMDAASVVSLTEAQCSAIAKILCSEAHKTKARPNNHEILSIARIACCKVGLHKSLEQKYGALPERFYLKAAKLCSEHDIQVNWHQEGFNCPRGCKQQEDQNMEVELISTTNECRRLFSSSSISQSDEFEMDECHYVIDSRHFKWKHLQTIFILSDDISFGQEKVPISCVVDKHLIDLLHIPTYSFDGKLVFLPWEGFTYATKSLVDPTCDVNTQNLQLGCSCSQSACSPETCHHVDLFNSDYENAKDINGKSMEGRFPYDDKGRLIIKDDYFVHECNHLCKCEKTCPNRVLQNGVRVKLEVFKTEKKGWAVRSREKILRGTFVCELIGEVLGMHEANRRRIRYGKNSCGYIFDIGTRMKNMRTSIDEQAEYFLDSTRYGNVSRFINHSCSPNLAVNLVLVESMDFPLAHVGLYAKQNIEAGEELTFDYHHQLQPEEGFPCLCKAPNCRGRIW